MASGGELPVRFAADGGTMARTIHVVLRNDVVVIVELRILGFLVPFRVRLGRIFRFLAHGLLGRANLLGQPL
jgi:hypothetical protein